MVIGERTLLQVELLDPRLVGGDGGALDTNAILLDGFGSVDGNLVVGLVTVFQALLAVRLENTSRTTIGPYQVIVLQVDVEVSVQLVLEAIRRSNVPAPHAASLRRDTRMMDHSRQDELLAKLVSVTIHTPRM